MALSEKRVVAVANCSNCGSELPARARSRSDSDSDYSVVVVSQIVSQRFAHILNLYAKPL